MKRRPRPLTVVAGVLLALAVLYLTVPAILMRPRQDEALFTAEDVGTAPEARRQVLADGVVTLAEMEAAWEAERACLQDAGYSPGPAGVDGPGAGFEIEVDYTGEADSAAADREFDRTYRRCHATHAELVAHAYFWDR